MTGSLSRIEKDMATLDEAVANITQEFNQVYENYLTVLGKALRQQLILAAYHLCTQGYPESFIKLSFSDRQKFQQDLQQLALNTQHTLLSLLSSSTSDQTLIDFTDQAEPESVQEYDEEDDEEDPDDHDHQELVPSSTSQFLSQPQSLEPLTPPKKLTLWQENLERAIDNLLKTLSRNANILIQKSGIFPQKLPESLLEVASQTESTTEAVASPPNLLNLMIQTTEAEESQNSRLTRLMIIHLRLSEIEFADATVMAGRHQIRNLLTQLNQIRRDYQKKLRERAVLEAESAWRSCWFESDVKE